MKAIVASVHQVCPCWLDGAVGDGRSLLDPAALWHITWKRNAGLAGLRADQRWGVGRRPGGALAAPPAIMFAGRLAELLSVALFAIHAWPRVKPVGA